MENPYLGGSLYRAVPDSNADRETPRRCARCGQRFRARESRYHDVLTGKDYHVYHAPQATAPAQDLGFRPANELLGKSSTRSTRNVLAHTTRQRRPKRRIGLDY